MGKTGKTQQLFPSMLDNKLREDLERMKKIRQHRGLRHYWGLKVRGQHTCSRVRCGPLFSRPTAAPWGVNILLFLKKYYIQRMLVLGGGPTRAPLENAYAAYFFCRRSAH